MPEIWTVPEAVEGFLSEGLIREVLSVIKTGKEATAYLCRAAPRLHARYAVAKVYHDLEDRDFNRSSIYEEGRVILNGQVRRAIRSHSDFGRKAEVSIWVDYEYEALCTLFNAGAGVPEPYASDDQAILMAYLGDGSTPAPQLQHVTLAPDEARATWERLLWNVELMIANNLVHGDLSAFNVLYWKGRPTIIDLPQAVDPRFNHHARSLLERDLRNLAKYFERYGGRPDTDGIAADLWHRWQHGGL